MTNQEFLAAVRVAAFRGKVRAKRAIAKQIKRSARKNRLAIRRIKVLAVIFFAVILFVRPGTLETASSCIALIGMFCAYLTTPKSLQKKQKTLTINRPAPKKVAP
ncbi:MAG: hypothetical protein ACREHG_05215 [Candidatus Saccharimonadales bacterium]